MSYLGNDGRFANDAQLLSDIRDELERQLLDNSNAVGIPAPEFEDDEQWAFPYGRFEGYSFAIYCSDYGEFDVRFFMDGIVEESASIESSKLFKENVQFTLRDPSGLTVDIEVGKDIVDEMLDNTEMAGGYSYWMEPRKAGSWADDIFTEEGADLAGIAAEAILEQIRYREVMHS